MALRVRVIALVRDLILNQGLSMRTPKAQTVPVKMYRSLHLLTVAAPMAGVGPEDIAVEVTADGRLVLHGELSGNGPETNREVLVEEWIIGPYHRELALPAPVDGESATVTYGNGVLVVALPLVQRTRPARLRLEPLGPTRGERAGNPGHPHHRLPAR